MKSDPNLQVVDDEYLSKTRVYALGFDDEFAGDVMYLEGLGRLVINGDEDRTSDEVDLRVHLQALTMADELMLPALWWTSAVAHQLVTVAGWLGIRLIDPFGKVIETAGMKARA